MADTKENLICPACGHSMKKIFVPSAGINVDLCLEGCGGIFFDNRELEKFDEETEDISVISGSLHGRDFETTDEEAVRHCPACGTPMVKIGGAEGSVEIDSCNVCGGKFLDYGELEEIREICSSRKQQPKEVLTSVFENFDKNYSAKQRQLIEEVVEHYLD